MSGTEEGDNTDRHDFLEWAEKQFGTRPEYLWLRYPDYAVLRAPLSGKWYAVVMTVGAKKLGLPETGEKGLLVVKCDPSAISLLLSQKGFVPAYHMNKTSWIGILLDGSAAESDIKALTRASLEAVSPKKVKKGRRKTEI